ncbi:PREDICTED: receptor-like protein 12 [Lupinus angustifolius]|uniref:receptor-like protein 12 n=1 Tax=Lupinus angustifolius TaxID=3871 RepID=UPI00092F8A2B|nr:PREDICTED: receptor-like protein 12 [Lupinus angustifolius]
MVRYLISAAFAVLFLFGEICMSANNSSMPLPCIQRERDALLNFKASLHDPSNRLSSWEGNHCCQWEHITCHDVTAHVVKLDLSNPCWRLVTQDESFKCYRYERLLFLSASNVDPSLSELEYLSYLDLSDNDFRGSPIPISIGSMRSLTYLSLSEANFGGKIPTNLGNLTNLTHLDLGYNYGIHANQSLNSNDINWISKLGLLEHLDLSGVNLGGIHNLLQVLNMLPSLLRFYLAGCQVSDMIIPLVNHTNIALSLQLLDLSQNNLNYVPSLSNMTSIESLDLSYNKLTLFPSWFCNFKKLVHLDLSLNALVGPIPKAIRNLTSIEFLDFSRNHLTSVPCWFVEFKKLVHLDLSQNHLTHMECSLSSILTNLCQLRFLNFASNILRVEQIGDSKLFGCITYDLKELDLSYNEFRGSLPAWFGQLENLVQLNLASNFFYGLNSFSPGELKKLDHYNNTFDGKLYGSFDNTIAKLVNLQWLDLSNNYLNGIIPQSIGELVNLQELDLSNNHLNGTIPQSLCQLSDLNFLIISGNKLHGNIPNDFDKLVGLTVLDLSSNNLDGIIFVGKEWSSIMPHLRFLNLSYNHINGSLPKNIGNIMPNLRELFLGSNLINGSIPNSLCQTPLYTLDLSKNKLSGEIPNCWMDTGYWEEINLSSNKLSGVFPSSFWNISSLIWLHLNNNNLQQRLPMSINALENLLILDLGENQLSGNIPSWIANTFPSLQILRMRQNMLTGSIPSQICQLSSLKILDLSRNILEGSIPLCLGNLTGMVLRNSESNLNISPISEAPTASTAEAPEPEWSKEDVKQIIKGREDDYIKILKLVVNMDLSENKLVGSIPNGITLLNGLHFLNLSYNHLEGEIPEMIGDMKSLESFDVSHNQLSGSIPNSMPSLTSLSHINLAHNNFSGPVPQANQFLTYNSSVYADNPYLCGHELPNKCPGDESIEVTRSRGNEDKDDKKDKVEKVLFYFVVAVGLATGFWGVIGVLLLKKNWRHAYFRWVEDTMDDIYVAVVLKLAKLKKK